MKKKIAMLLMFVLLSCSIKTGCVEANDAELMEPLTVFSPQFPDAYILIEENATPFSYHQTDMTICASVFVKETYLLDESGNITVESSELLSQEEVMAVGMENFENNIVEDAGTNETIIGSRSEDYQKLTIEIVVSEIFDANFEGSYKVNGSASWSSGSSLFNLYGTPAGADDFCSISWGGNYLVADYDAVGTPSYSVADTSSRIALADVDMNKGVVWRLDEYWTEFVGGHNRNIYLTNVDMEVLLQKKNLTGEGELTGVVMEYIHTYKEAEISPKITFGYDGENHMANVEIEISGYETY